MPALDRCHEQIIRALEKEDWRVISSPFKLAAAERTAYVDVQLQRGSNGTREHIILIEIKCFPDESRTTRELYTAIGQYMMYRKMMREIELPFPLYLAVPVHMYDAIFDTIVQGLIGENQIKLVLVNIETETVIQWLP